MRSPGHKKSPNHAVREREINRDIEIAVAGEVVARASTVIEVQEDNHPSRYYIPRGGITMGALRKSNITTYCPFKGTACYFHVQTASKLVENAAWSYEDPYDEHASLKDLVALHSEDPAVEIRWLS
jgi:uncharacterized protein (DUF427 family)